jgi:hypothetical protein
MTAVIQHVVKLVPNHQPSTPYALHGHLLASSPAPPFRPRPLTSGTPQHDPRNELVNLPIQPPHLHRHSNPMGESLPHVSHPPTVPVTSART